MADDKFIMIGIDDDRSKDIADVLGSSTCKKILNYLADTKEASEKDISDALGIPLNTTEYNLNKLKKAGLVEKAKNFFWSRKGRKIDMYKLAKKHIVISPKISKPNMTQLKSVLPVILIAAILVVAFAGIYILIQSGGEGIVPGNYSSSDSPKQFTSFDDLKSFLNASAENAKARTQQDSMTFSAPTAGAGIAKSANVESAGASSYSHTNIQVEGVDEADIVKNDGKYIYTLSGSKLNIVNAYPAEQMEIVKTINFSSPSNIFINKDKLIVFAISYRYSETGADCPVYTDSYKMAGVASYYPNCGGTSTTYTDIYIYNIMDRKNPVLERNISVEGDYQDSRMIGDYVYLINSKYIYNYDNPYPPLYEVNGVKSSVPISNIYYFDYYDNSYVFNSISAININKDEINTKVYLTGGTGTVYVSEKNIFLTYLKQMNYGDYAQAFAEEVALKILPEYEKAKVRASLSANQMYYSRLNDVKKIIFDYSNSLIGQEKADFDKQYMDLSNSFQTNLQKRTQKTAISKISIDKDKINYEGAGDVPGHILNQFSMDEYDNHFRIATTTGEVWSGNSLNHLFVLDKDLKTVGSIEDLAKGEKIYSVRFIGKRGYIVTFKKVDPLFVIDLSNPENPQVLGYLKIPGYSDYLHPYDENHIIGIGKEAIDASSAETSARNLDFAWYQGVKIALFDITDVEHPTEKAKFVIGDRGTDSPALYDHKAFLFDKDKKLLAIPINLVEIDRTKYKVCTDEEKSQPNSYSYCLSPTTYGQQTWQGVYVLNIDLNGISLRGRVSHLNETNETKYGAAKDEPIGATRTDAYETVWKKIDLSGRWITDKPEYEYSIYTDDYIDNFPGGINYHPNIYDYRYQIQRSLYMDDVLYTISNSKVKANDLVSLNPINSVDLGYSGYDYGRVMY